MTAPNSFPPGDFSVFFDKLALLDDHPPHYFIFGGQAVNIWADFFLGLGYRTLQDFRPFTSRDCDVWVDNEGFQQIDSLFGFAKIFKSDSPVDGQLAVVKTIEEPTLVVDFLSMVYGIRRETMPRLQLRAQDLDGIFVMDPLYLFKGKCNNLANLPQKDRQDARHVEMLKLIVPAFMNLTLESLRGNEVSERDVIKEFKLLLEFKNDRSVRQVSKAMNFQLTDFLPLNEDLREFSKLEKFIASIKGGKTKA